jgi:hypothetical protein
MQSLTISSPRDTSDRRMNDVAATQSERAWPRSVLQLG